MRNKRTTSHRKISTSRLSPVMKTWTPATSANKTTCLCRDTGGKGRLLVRQHTTFNTLDNWAINPPLNQKGKGPERKGYRVMAQNMYTIHSVTKIIIIKRISRVPIYGTRWEHRALYNNTNTHRHTCKHLHVGQGDRHSREKQFRNNY